MLKKIKYCNQLIELSNDKSEIDFLQLKIYIMILGYFACKKDNTFPSFFIHDDIIFKLEERIKTILKFLNIKCKIETRRVGIIDTIRCEEEDTKLSWEDEPLLK